MKHQIIKNLFSNYVLTATGIALGLFMVPFLIRKLGHQGFGVTVVAEALILFFFVVVSAIRTSVSRFVTLSLSQNKIDDVLLYLSTGKRMLDIYMGWALGAGLAVCAFFPALFRVPQGLDHQAQAMFLLIVLGFVLSIPNAVYWAVLYGHQRFDLINLSNAGGVILRAVAVFLLFSLLPGPWANVSAYGVAYLVTTLAQNYIVYRWAVSLMPAIGKIGHPYDTAKAAEIFSYARYTLLGTVSRGLYDIAVPILINLCCGLSANTFYAVASRIPNVLKRVFLEPAWSLIPICTHYAAQGDRQRLERLFFIYSKAVMAVFWPLMFSVAVCSRMVLHLWLGNGFVSAAGIMMILSVSALFNSFAYLSSMVLSAYGKIKIPALVLIGWAVAGIGSGAALSFFFKMGVTGMALGVLIGTAGGALFFSPAYTCHVLESDVKDYWLGSFLVPMLLTFICFGWEIFFRNDGHCSWPFFGFLAAAVLLYGALVFRYIFNAAQRNDVLSLLWPRFEGNKRLFWLKYFILNQKCVPFFIIQIYRRTIFFFKFLVKDPVKYMKFWPQFLDGRFSGDGFALSVCGPDLLRDSVEACRSVGISPFLTFGTLLGFAREKDFIAHDNDIDLGLLEEDFQKKDSIKKSLARKGYKLRYDDDYTLSMFHPDYPTLFIDFWRVYRKDGELVIGMLSTLDKNTVFYYHFPIEAMNEFKVVDLRGVKVLVPLDPTIFLSVTYGQWQVPQRNYDHIYGCKNLYVNDVKYHEVKA